MSEITPEYIAAITREELEAEGYQFMQEYSNWWLFLMPDHVAHDGGYHTLDDALQAAREHYAPGRMLRELQQRNAALEALVREAYEAIDTDTDREGYFIRHIPTMQKDWRERAAKLLEGTE